MDAGRALDAAVAEKVMGLSVSPAYFEIETGHGPIYWVLDADGIESDLVPAYSTSIDAAWQVIEKLADRDPMLAQRGYADGSVGWYCDLEGIQAHARTAPHAICMAALKAVGVEI